MGVARPGGQFAIEVFGGVGEGREQQDFAVAGIDRRVQFFGDNPAQLFQLGIPRRGDQVGGGQQGRQAVAVLSQILAPAHPIHVLQQYANLTTDQQGLERGIIDVDIVDHEFVHRVDMAVDLRKQAVHVTKLALNGEVE